MKTIGFLIKGIGQYIRIVALVAVIINLITACESFVDIDAPRTDLINETVFTSNETATAAISDIYGQMINYGFASGDAGSANFLMGLSSDELQNVNDGFYGPDRQVFNDNELTPTNSFITSIWSELYQYIFKANSIIEGLENLSGVTSEVRQQLIGEAEFIRAFSHFYLVNLFGEVPIVLTTDYRTNANLSRFPESKVYEQIISDLKSAQLRLSDDYSFSKGERVRPNKWAATALLARVYLYAKDWANAEKQATDVITNTTYGLVIDLNSVFHANSMEAIWQLATPQNSLEALYFIFADNPTNAMIENQLITSFEIGDFRKEEWIGYTTVDTETFYYPYKYKIIGPTDPVVEYSMVLRFAEQYLIRAESRAQQGKISGAQSDLNMIRKRAGLTDTPANDQNSILLAIEQERKVELFTEWGHRWLDLKRSNRADAILSIMKSGWQSTDVLYPIPQLQIDNNPNMARSQNPGY